MTDKTASHSSSILLLFIPLRSGYFPFSNNVHDPLPVSCLKTDCSFPETSQTLQHFSERLFSKDEELDMLSVSTTQAYDKHHALSYELFHFGSLLLLLRHQDTDLTTFPHAKKKTPFLCLFVCLFLCFLICCLDFKKKICKSSSNITSLTWNSGLLKLITFKLIDSIVVKN